MQNNSGEVLIMEINLDNNSNLKIEGYSNVGKNPIQKTTHKDKNNTVEVKSPMMEAMSLLKDIPEVRMDKVALAKQLIADPNYPSQEVLDKVADALLGANSDSYNE